MSDIITPVTDASEEQLTMVRSFTSHRLRETQPLLNAATQDSIPGAGSGDS